jgi:mRNA-degrading endonuclease RelE of RelBE toxin-antitoxin system
LKEVAFEKEIAKAKEALKNMEILAKKYQDQVLKIIKQNKELSAAVVQLGGIETLN